MVVKDPAIVWMAWLVGLAMGAILGKFISDAEHR